MPRKACFLDRDGVVNVEKYYLHDPDAVELETGVGEALKKLSEAGFVLVVVTNQAGVAKGKYPESDIAPVHRRIDELLAPFGVKIARYYHCPHHPDFTGPCDCRKPAPGMLLRAARELDLNPAESFMIGDRISDLDAGRNAGVKKSILVLTGYGRETLAHAALGPAYGVAENLPDAVAKYIL